MSEPTLQDAWSNWTPGPRWNCYSEDERHIEGLHKDKVTPDNLDWERLVVDTSFGAEDRRLHLNLTPIPFLGDLERAKVVILLQNPGLSPTDYYGEFKVDGFQQLLLKNLRSELRNTDYPFLFLNPALAWHGGWSWWHRQLGSVIEVMAGALDMTYMEARKSLARSIACIELMPYHSKSRVVPDTFVAELPSANVARTYMNGLLVKRAQEREVTIVAARHLGPWGFVRSSTNGEFEPPANLSNDSCVLYGTKLARSASLSAASAGGRAILLAMGVPRDHIPEPKARSGPTE